MAVSSAARPTLCQLRPPGAPPGSRALRPARACNPHVHVRQQPEDTSGPPGRKGRAGTRGRAPGRTWARLGAGAARTRRAGPRGRAGGRSAAPRRDSLGPPDLAANPGAAPHALHAGAAGRASAHARQGRAGAPLAELGSRGRARAARAAGKRRPPPWEWTRLGVWPRAAAGGIRDVEAVLERGRRTGAEPAEDRCRRHSRGHRSVPALTVTLFCARRRASVQRTERGQTLRHAGKKGAARAGTSGRPSQRRTGLQGVPGDL